MRSQLARLLLNCAVATSRARICICIFALLHSSALLCSPLCPPEFVAQGDWLLSLSHPSASPHAHVHHTSSHLPVPERTASHRGILACSLLVSAHTHSVAGRAWGVPFQCGSVRFSSVQKPPFIGARRTIHDTRFAGRAFSKSSSVALLWMRPRTEDEY